MVDLLLHTDSKPVVAPPTLCDGCGGQVPESHHHYVVGLSSYRVNARIFRRFCSTDCRAKWRQSPGPDPDVRIYAPHIDGIPCAEHCECHLKTDCVRCDPATRKTTKGEECTACFGTGKMTPGPLLFCSHDPAHAHHEARFDRDLIVSIYEHSHGMGHLRIGPLSHHVNHPAFLMEQYKAGCPCQFKEWFEKAITPEEEAIVRSNFRKLQQEAIDKQLTQP